MKLKTTLLTAGALLATSCTRGAEGPAYPTPAPIPNRTEWEPLPADRPAWRVGFADLAPREIQFIPRWTEEEFGVERPRTTWRMSDQPVEPIRWDAVTLDEDGALRPGDDNYSVYHGNGCCGGCQTVATLGAVMTQHRIDQRRPVPLRDEVPHRPDIPEHDDDLDIRGLMGTSRQTFIRGGRDIPRISPALAVVGAPVRSALWPYIEENNPWMPGPLCEAVAGHDLPVLRARVRQHNVRFMTAALQQGPVIISGAFNRLERAEDDLFRCPGDPPDQRRHHFMLVIGWEGYDSDGDGEPDEVVWLARDDWDHQGRDHRDMDRDTWTDRYPDDEWMRIVPRGCLLDRGRAHSIVPGSVTLGSFDNPTVPGPNGVRTSYCMADPDRDGVPTIRDTCPFTPDPAQVDRDDDRMGDLCDPCPDTPPVRRPEFGHQDDDTDGVPDACDRCPGEDDEGCTEGDAN